MTLIIRSLVAALLISFIAASAPAQDAKPNFTGKWTLDLAKSDFGEYPPPDSIVHVIDHKEPVIKLVSTTKQAQMGEVTNETRLTTDGKENPNKLKIMGTEQDVKSTAKWDGDKLATATAFDAQGTTVQVNDVWTLSDGGKILTIMRVVKTPQGDFNFKIVYTKQ